MRAFLGAFGEPGHAFPVIALGSRLASRGHQVTIETWTRWRTEVEAAGARFLAAPEYPVFPTGEQPLGPYEAVARATVVTRQALRAVRPDVVIHDILTLAPGLAAELEGVPAATLIPHVHPATPLGLPPYASGARIPRTAVGRAAWSGLQPLLRRGLEQGRAELNATRAQVGLPPVERLHGGLSQELCLVATFPQLEYERVWPAGTHVVGPLLWEPPAEAVEPPPGSEPLVLIAPSTAQDPEHRLLRAALTGLAGEPVRVLATWNRRPLRHPVALGRRQRLVEWLSYERTMPRCDLVICHAGHGTMVRALASGVPVLAVPHAGDMAENAARVDWAGAGVRLPWRLLSPATVRLAVRRALGSPELGIQATQLSLWAATHDGAERCCELVEALAHAGSGARPSGTSA